MDQKLYKVIVGLALESEIHNRRINKNLMSLFSNPTLQEISSLHQRFIASNDHFDREVAFWLDLALERAPVKIDLQDMIKEINEMEVLLSDLLWQVSPDSQRDLNDWLNYIVNAAQGIQDGFDIDAKTLMSLAVQSSKTPSIEKSKKDPSLRHSIEVLQMETSRLFEEIKKCPLKLMIPEEHLDIIIELQGILINLLQKYCLESLEKEVREMFRYPIEKLETSQRYLMRSEIGLEKTKQELDLAAEQLQRQVDKIHDKKTREIAKKIHEKITSLSKKLS